MMFSRILILLLATFALGACGSLESRQCKACQENMRRESEEAATLNALGYAGFPQAEAPRFDHDERTQEERDLELIGRRP